MHTLRIIAYSNMRLHIKGTVCQYGGSVMACYFTASGMITKPTL